MNFFQYTVNTLLVVTSIHLKLAKILSVKWQMYTMTQQTISNGDMEKRTTHSISSYQGRAATLEVHVERIRVSEATPKKF